jgi:hypothetical protein
VKHEKIWLTLNCNKKNGPPGPGPGSRAQINIVQEAFGKHDLFEHAAASARFPRSARFSQVSPVQRALRALCTGVLGAHLGEGPPGDARSARLPSPPLRAPEIYATWSKFQHSQKMRPPLNYNTTKFQLSVTTCISIAEL